VLNSRINPILKNYDCPELYVKIGIDEGVNVVLQYAYDRSSQIDILGYTMNISAKITSLTGPNKVSVGENIYKLLHPVLLWVFFFFWFLHVRQSLFCCCYC
jgi:class 3 adenylate cyclase